MAEPTVTDQYDICECGDYRRDHEGPENRGRCGFNRIGHHLPKNAPENVCGKFRFSSRGHAPEDFRQNMHRNG